MVRFKQHHLTIMSNLNITTSKRDFQRLVGSQLDEVVLALIAVSDAIHVIGERLHDPVFGDRQVFCDEVYSELY